MTITTIADLCRFIENSEPAPSLKLLAERARMSPFHLQRIFKAATGLTPKAYADARRADRVRAELKRNKSVTEAIYDAGFNSSGRFYENAHRLLGMTPTEFRAGGADTTIRFAIGECSLGSVLVAAGTKGICAVSIGDDPNALIREFQKQFSKAVLIGGDTSFERLVATVVGFVEKPTIACNLPLDIRGTAFQQRVWSELRKIPFGTTVTYAELAKRIGSPTAVRAVAGACGANKLAVLIPCHRVIRTGGGLSGYRWGVERKRALLLKERTNK